MKVHTKVSIKINMKINHKQFNQPNHTYIMGILNVTPDSFSDGGRFTQLDAALQQVERMISEGADVIDIGGESTRPGFEAITIEEEIQRTARMIEAITARFDIPVSIDTYKSEVAKAALSVGASMVNDVWGLKHDPKMASVVKEYDVPVCIMHNRHNMDYHSLLPDMISDLHESIQLATDAGIESNQIILDPGIGFAKTREHNLLVMKNLGHFHSLGYPILLGASRKSMIGLTLDLPVEERLEGTLATTVVAVLAGCAWVRVHDVKENKRVIQMTEAMRDA